MFIDVLIDRVRSLGTPLCVGLDPSIELMTASDRKLFGVDGGSASPERCAEALYSYCERILEAVSDLVPVVKPQCAYFELYGSYGIAALERVVRSARDRGLLVVLDAKRGDIGATSRAYAKAYLTPGGSLGVDAITVSPYLGPDSLEPFIRAAAEVGKGIFVCARTSNPGAAALQDLTIGNQTVAELVADWVQPWSEKTRGICGFSGIGLVVGATDEQSAQVLRKRLPDAIFLVPGFGAQGGTVDAIRACFNDAGIGAIVNVSRSIIYPHLFKSAEEQLPVDIRRRTRDVIRQLRGAMP
jgi:orotidine-5'-phosphate decarboxylase